MPKIATPLSAAQVARLTRPGLHSVGNPPGLQMQVTTSGARTWILRVLVGKKRRDIGLGGYPAVSLAQARERAREARDKVWRGVDPVEERKAARAALLAQQNVLTFDECARRYLSGKTVEFKNPKHAAQWKSTLAMYASPVIGKLPVNAVALEHVVDLLTCNDLWTTKTETASRLRGRVESVLAWATVSGHRTGDNPARWRGNLDAVLPKPTKLAKVEHFAAMKYQDVPGFLVDLRTRSGIGARALEFAILTAARSGEVRGATWAEIDFDAATWTIPAERMKAGKEHIIPLTPEAIALLQVLPRMEGSDFVFNAPRGGALSDMALTKILRDMNRTDTTHGFRSSFRDWAGETTNFAREIIEHALAHQLKDKAEAAYARGTLLAKRRKLMEAWAKFCASPRPAVATVTPIKRKAK